MPGRAFKRELSATYFAPLLAMGFLAVIVLWRVNAQISITKWIEHADDVLMLAKDAEVEFREMQTAARSYAASHETQYLNQLRSTRKLFELKLEDVAVAVADNPDQERRWIRVTKTYLPGKFEDIIKDTGQPPSAVFAQSTAYSQGVLDALQKFVTAEYEVRERRVTDQRRIDQAIIVLVPLCSLLIAVALSYWGWREIGVAGDQFSKALTRAEEANRTKDNFLATVSHELRNPLNSIMLSTGILLSDHEVREGARQRLKAIDRSARTQARLIDDLLDVSRIERGRLRLDVQATDLAQVVKGGVDSMRVAAEAKSIDLHDVIDTGVSLIAGDPKRLEQVVWNLLSNAIKFTPKGGKVQVRLERINSHVELNVTDNGQGLAPESLPHLFDRFWQDTGSEQSRLGMGLGLSIVKELVALHGGTVLAHSDGVGKGSTFTVRLPLPVSTAPLLEPRRHPTLAPVENAAAAPRLDGLSILVVDDDHEACDALTRLLGSLGATASAATSARAALRKIDGVRLDAIVADIGMPVEDGFFFVREVRKREQDGEIKGRVPMVAVTAYGRIDDKIKILASGFDSHLVKPVELGELSAIIGSLVAAHSAH